jgi:hypothetical protein
MREILPGFGFKHQRNRGGHWQKNPRMIEPGRRRGKLIPVHENLPPCAFEVRPSAAFRVICAEPDLPALIARRGALKIFDAAPIVPGDDLCDMPSRRSCAEG